MGSVVDKNGVRARLEVASMRSPEGEAQMVVRTEEGYAFVVPASVLVELKDGGYFLPIGLDELAPADAGFEQGESGAAHATVNAGDEVLVVPVIAEELSVGKRTVEHGRVRITKTIAEREEIVDEPLRAEDVSVERVPINRIVDAPPPVRYEGDVMIVPLLEEVLVVERRLMLREEVRVSKQSLEVHKPQRVVLRSEEAVVERVTPEGEATALPENL